MNDSVLLVGCGKLGRQLNELLVPEGSRVLALRRRPSGLPGSVRTISADLSRPLTSQLPQVGSMVITLPPGRASSDHDDNFYGSALAHLAQALPATPHRTVLVSSTGVFGHQSAGQPLTEADEPQPTSGRAHTLLNGERLAADLFDAHIIRPAGIYGPGRDMRVRRVREGSPVAYSQRTNRIHETDLVRTLHRLLRDDAPPALLHAVEEAPATLGEVVTYIAD